MEEDETFAPKESPRSALLRQEDAHASRHVTFDEAVIKEHDLLRGTRQKIDEPDTPYHRGSFDDNIDGQEEEMMVVDGNDEVAVVYTDEADAQVQGVLKAQNRDDHGIGAMASQGVLDFDSLRSKLDSVQQYKDSGVAHDPNFESKRKQHYNEYEMLRKWKEQHKDENEEEEEGQE